ncbi:hypothetical protein ANN_10457 [Periplaneta americana]|uniref:Ig-like domain-containing protein n=1 Tax=Periplaneta americana TaxID=6978 RepID=A0ABQ8TRC8_PERAM|nr:hypothetical protein ANN_10457 [Periplaneta americana]
MPSTWPGIEPTTLGIEGQRYTNSDANQSLMLAGSEFQSLGRAIVKEDEYEEVSSDGNITQSTLTFTPTLADNGKTLTCRAVNKLIDAAVEEDSWKLNVFYVPMLTLELGTNMNPDDIEEGDDVYFECKIDANPWAYKVVWKHNENAEILIQASKAIGLEVNPEKTKYMILSRDENIVRNGNIKIGDLSFEEVEKFKYLGATVTNINDTREEIKRRINMGNACYYSVEKLLSSSMLSKNLKFRLYKTVILPVVLYCCETWTLTLKEERRLRVFENKVLRKIFGAKRDEVTGEWRKLHKARIVFFT